MRMDILLLVGSPLSVASLPFSIALCLSFISHVPRLYGRRTTDRPTDQCSRQGAKRIEVAIYSRSVRGLLVTLVDLSFTEDLPTITLALPPLASFCSTSGCARLINMLFIFSGHEVSRTDRVAE